ncbi:MAG: type II toxin-antitoxin system Phd/YefM family antitoxin [Desulfuromonadales bacterium]|nr:type II toxin-antitoxin system Phd/YefM family antitoxin [Desulfuromonadales bacterium]
MKAYNFTEARKRLAEVLDTARQEEVLIKRRGGETFSLVLKKNDRSPFDIPGVDTAISREEILAAVRESRERL